MGTETTIYSNIIAGVKEMPIFYFWNIGGLKRDGVTKLGKNESKEAIF